MKPRFKPGDLIIELDTYPGYKTILEGPCLVLEVHEEERPEPIFGYHLLVNGEIRKMRTNFIERYFMLLKDYDSKKKYEI